MGAFSRQQARTVLAAVDKSNPVVGVAADRHRLALVLSTGQVWSAALGGKSAAALASVIEQTTRPVWTVEPMHRTARALVDLGAESAAHRMRNTTAAEAIILPDPEQRRAGERQVGTDRHDAETAATVAATVASWISGQETGVRRLALRAVELDMVWRPRMIAGWSVDFDALELALEKAAAERARIYIGAGLPLADALTDTTHRQALAWLAEVGLNPRHLGTPSLTKDAVEELPEPPTGTEAWRRWELITAATRYKKAQPALSGIERGYSRGRVHAEMRLFSTRTGRTSVSRAALQGIGSANRHLLRAAAGKVLVSVDLAQAEVRIAAALSGDTRLMAALDAGDAYATMAKTIWGVAEVTPELRARAKTIMISVLYGKGVTSTSTSLGVSVDEARELIEQFWNAYPQLSAFNEACKAAAGTQVHTVTLGRPLPITPEAYKQLNLRVQAEGADLITTRAAEVAARLGAEALWLSIHDELVVEVIPDRAEHAAQVLADVVTAPLLDVPMRGTPEILGRAWRK